MKIYAINGGPRKSFNTAKMLASFLDGVKSEAPTADVEMINLYDYDYKGCYECYACKLKDGESYGKCSYPDGIKELLKNVSLSDGVVFGSPIYFSGITAQLRGFLERLFYPFTAFKRGGKRVIAPKKVHSAFLYTMNITEDAAKRGGYEQNLSTTHMWTEHVLGFPPEVLYAYNTFQYKDYDRYVADLWDIEGKKIWHDTQFPKDLESAFEAGRDMVNKILL